MKKYGVVDPKKLQFTELADVRRRLVKLRLVELQRKNSGLEKSAVAGEIVGLEAREAELAQELGNQ